MDEILAKSDGCTLVEHTKMVLNIGIATGECLLRDKEYDYQLTKKSVLSELAVAIALHDIGKCKTNIQGIIRKKTNEPTEHNIYSWSFFIHHINGGSSPKNNPIANAILLHHPVDKPFFKKKSSDYIFTQDELAVAGEIYNNLLGYISDTFGFEYDKQYSLSDNDMYGRIISDEKIYDNINVDDPSSFRKSHNREAVKQILRTCLIFADRVVSSNVYDRERLLSNDKDYIYNEILKPKLLCNESHFHNIDIFSLNQYDSSRLTQQYKVVKYVEELNISDKNTLCVNATAGFGKSLIGVLWFLETKRKTIWVTPRNIIASSTYNSIVSELDNIGEKDVKVASYFSGEYIAKNYEGDDEPDILVTNIDSILYRNNKNDKQILLFNVYGNNMIFDEYHEFKCGEPLFSGFIRMIYTRKQFTNTKTMMLSATPLDFSCLYFNDYIDEYKPLQLYNDMNVNVSLKEYSSLDEVVCGNDSFVIVPFVKWAQKLYNKSSKDNEIIHARYADNDRLIKEKRLIKQYGKHADVVNKKIVYGTNIIGVGLDISARNIYDFYVTPEDTIQRGCGRSGRFNEKEYNGSVNYNICRLNDMKYFAPKKSRKKGAFNDRIQNEFTETLYYKWFEMLKKYNNKTITKGDLYVLRDKFYKENGELIEQMYINLFKRSDEAITDIYLVSSKKKGDKKLISKDNTYRGVSVNNIFVTVKKSDGDYTEPININDCIINESNTSDMCNRRKKYLEGNPNVDKERMKYVYKMKTTDDFTVEKCKSFAYDSTTPLLLINATYDSEIGLNIKE